MLTLFLPHSRSINLGQYVSVKKVSTHFDRSECRSIMSEPTKSEEKVGVFLRWTISELTSTLLHS